MLDGASEVPSKTTAGTGVANVVLDDAAYTLAVNLSFSGLSGTATAIAIHCCASPTMNAGIALQFTADEGVPLGGYSGDFSYLFDLTSLALGAGLTPATFASQLEAGNAYLNIHTYLFVAGEIRGQIVQSLDPQISGSTAPEPAAALFAASALVLISLKSHRQRR